MYSQKRLSQQKKEKILKELKEHAADWFNYWKMNNESYRYHTSFLNGQQWDDMDIQNFKSNNRPVITINKISPYIKQALGEYRKNIFQVFLRKMGVEEDKDDSRMQESVLNNLMPKQPQQQMPQGQQMQGQQGQTGQMMQGQNVATDISQLVKATPVIPQDPKLKIYEGLLRQIAYCSDAEEVYYWAGKCALEGGFGAFQILTEYDEGLTLRQRLKLERKIDPTKCYWDRFAQHTTKIDGDYCGTLTVISKAEFERKYPDAEYPASFSLPGDEQEIFWGDKDFITIGEEYQKEYFKDIALFNAESGEIYYKSELDEDELKSLQKNKKFQEADCDNYRVIYYKYTDIEILEKTECPLKYCGIVFVDGNSSYDKTSQKTQSFIKDAVDAQKALNFIASDIILWLKLAKKNQWLVPEETIPEELLKWWNQTDNPPAFLPYKGQAAQKYGSKPEMTPPPAMPQDLLVNYQRLTNDIREALGRFEANIGASSNENSGVAVANRAMQGASTIEPFRDNLRKAVIACGRVLLSAMPKVYDDERLVTITNRDGTSEEIPINKRIFDFKKMNYVLNIDMKKMGSWDIEVKAGASHAIQKQQDIDNIETLIKLDPSGQSYALLAPLLAEELDSPKAKQMASRLTFITPPAVLAAEQGKQFAPPPNPMAQLQMQGAQLQMMREQAEIQKLQSEVQNSQIKAMADKMTAMAKILEAKATMADVELRKDIEPQRLNAEVIHAEAGVQMKQKELEADMVKSAMAHHHKIYDTTAKHAANLLNREINT